MHSSDPRGPVTLLSVLLLITLLAALPGCAALRPPPAVDGPSVALLQACDEPAGSAETNGAMAEWLLAIRGALRGCNAQIEAFKAGVPATRRP